MVSANVETRPWPALFTSMSVRPKRFCTAFANALTSVGVEHVALRGQQLRIRELRFQRGFRLREPLRIATADRDRCARTQKQFGGCKADAGRTARHHRHLPGQIDLDHQSPNAFMYLLPAPGPFLGR